MSNSARLPDLPVFEPRESLREKVTRELRAALMTGRLEPGTVYSAPVLADQFGVSATPVREAMLDLVKEGLVQPVRNKGFRVTRMDEKALDDCIEVRQLIEPAAVERISREASAEAVMRWMPVAEEIVAAARAGDITGYIDADMRFHLGLLGESGNRLLVDTVRDLRYRSRLMGIPKLARAGMLEPSAQEHVELLKLMAAPDPAAARELMCRHLDHVRGLWAGVSSPPTL
ncbi:DNA-binding GntR family transcriptional regulator [Stackebrandtia endophytica]|uniref:DNA-binding GntR family transcriptional regulator n=1 Tax=Stackebrandtia endophytica TaxID=1496996 RepID=A0A543B4F2_9ACTN|nr:GntR family transcriptional regulator [Stackebrandtia endophytica]TQL79701.1 DNA-binding GntR family transcriptional regulator [Stackebrandtia endophytica]